MSAMPPPHDAAPVAAATAIAWPDPQREASFQAWLARTVPAHGLLPASLRLASADASFRRYFRIDATGANAQGAASRIIMDAPPDKENSEPFVRIAALMAGAGLTVPTVLDWDREQGFLLLSDLGTQTMMDVIDRERPEANAARYRQAIDALIALQTASRPDVLPPYDQALLQRELSLFPDWYITRHRGIALTDAMRATLDSAFTQIIANNLSAPSVYVHRDFMPRNLMVTPTLGAGASSLPPEGAPAALGRPGGGSACGLGVLDFQDAVYGPITYDIASLMRDAFLSWEEDFVIDITVRYWQEARKAGLLGEKSASGWGDDFGEFYRAVEWMGLQRHLKVAGIFARLTLRDGKPRYLADTPRFIAYIRATAGRYRELKPLLRLVDEIEGTQAVTGFAYGRV
jgi:aminoglycoside/choline kinase family phosphotransferase